MRSHVSRPPAPTTTLRILLSTVGRAAALSLAVGIVLLVIFFPYDTDAPLSAAEMAKERDYYGRAFAEKGREVLPSDSAESAEEERYVKVGQTIAKAYHIEEDLNDFIQKRNLASAKALDVGSGRGYLQDMVADYTGLDISPTASRFYHKPFVLGSATSMPLADNSFDLVWSIDVLEHVPNPEQALREIRRVAKDGAILYLSPAREANGIDTLCGKSTPQCEAACLYRQGMAGVYPSIIRSRVKTGPHRLAAIGVQAVSVSAAESDSAMPSRPTTSPPR